MSTELIQRLRAGDLEAALALATDLWEREQSDAAAIHLAAVHALRNERGSARMMLGKGTGEFPRVSSHLLRGIGAADFSAPLLGEVRELFDKYAPVFDSHLVEGLGYQAHQQLPALVATLTKRPVGVLWDLGCGTGLCAEGLRPLTEQLVGVDISPAMVQAASERGCYDRVFIDDIVHCLFCEADASIDVLFSADSLGYIGPLDALFEQAARVLRTRGMLVFTLEAGDDEIDYTLTPARRCTYGLDYLHRLAATFGFSICHDRCQSLRKQRGQEVRQHILALRRPDQHD